MLYRLFCTYCKIRAKRKHRPSVQESGCCTLEGLSSKRILGHGDDVYLKPLSYKIWARELHIGRQGKSLVVRGIRVRRV
jgi:hypothetical protein